VLDGGAQNESSEAAAPTERGRLIWVPIGLLAVALLTLAVVAAGPNAPTDGVLTWFQPGSKWTSAAVLASWTATLVAYALPRRGEGRSFGVITVVGLASLAIIGGLASFAARSGTQDVVLTPLWRTLRLFTGDPAEPLWEQSADGLLVPVALQAARFAAVAATFSTAALAAYVLWRRQATRLRMRFATFDDLVIGADDDGGALVRQMLAERRTGRSIGVVVRPGTSQDVVRELTDGGALVTELDGSGRSAQAVLATFITRPSWRRPRTWLGPTAAQLAAAVDRIYILAGDVEEATSVTSHVLTVLGNTATAGREAYVQVVVGLHDIDDAHEVRTTRVKSPEHVAVDALTAVEATATEQVGRVLRGSEASMRAGETLTLMLCGDTALTRAVLAEVDRRAREHAYLMSALSTGRTGGRNWEEQPARQGLSDRDLVTVPFPPTRVVVLDELAGSICRMRGQQSPDQAALVPAEPRELSWVANVEAQAEELRADGPLAILITGPADERSFQVASRLAARGNQVWVRTADRARPPRTHRPTLHEFQLSLLLDGWLPESTWTRIARLKHERYRREHFPPPGEPLKPTRRPWWHPDGDDARLPQKARDDNVAQVRHLVELLLKEGYTWEPSPGSPAPHTFQGCLFHLAEHEHQRWVQANCDDDDDQFCTPWADMSEDNRAHDAADVSATLEALAVHGLVPVAPPTASTYACCSGQSSDEGPPVCRRYGQRLPQLSS
jgi:hypothetical protein